MRISDWSSDVCSSDLLIVPNSFAGKGEAPSPRAPEIPETHRRFAADVLARHGVDTGDLDSAMAARQNFGDNMREEGAAGLLAVAFRPQIRSDERRVGKECGSTRRSRWSPHHSNTHIH